MNDSDNVHKFGEKKVIPVALYTTSMTICGKNKSVTKNMNYKFQ